MPELPEVERARKLIEDSCKGYKIASVDAQEDRIIFTGGTDHNEFAKEIAGRTITGCERKGKMFWITLSGEGRYPVMHFGMTGMIQLKGQEPTWYRRRPKESVDVWPPRFYKFVLRLEPQKGSIGDEPRELAFIDGRRLGRLRLVSDPVSSYPPVSELGFDPVLSHPTLEEFTKLLVNKKGTVKGVIMDQAFSAGVGNWVADEVLYQARIHPSCPIPALSEQNIKDLHHQLRAVPLTAISVNADSKLFPSDWLFRWRWSKGTTQKKQMEKDKKTKGKKFIDGEGGEDVEPEDKEFLELPDGSPATIKFIEVGGRTTALVEELQKMPEGVKVKSKIKKGGKVAGAKRKKPTKEEESDEDSELSDQSKPEEKEPERSFTARQRATAEKKGVNNDSAWQTKNEDTKSSAAERRTARATTGKSKHHQDSQVKKEEPRISKKQLEAVDEKPRKVKPQRGRKKVASTPESSELSDVPEYFEDTKT
ncbi:formamidopyrimidine-DNA glycosylase [Cryptococcus gattii E566]|uniref:Formamidopyrimidine-DNA glycosylase n=1 Tax=Cryptococcus gattii EJB2 TaxID=1296103 RepID=A0ABR5BMI3_9TREE|nr:formamidopyrimidine-DNA glycosylase [Cryptococcus gattii EJB2]KIY31696.1 formamidopyrimidine-DNA glycosylase [Cryptococcus gattii E566]KJE00806.1 formamidopyrimidine-DNA glycosylase [Cryptococcus gattii NT-10]